MKRMHVSPLSGGVSYGSVNKTGTAFIGAKADVTSDFLRCVIEKAQFHGGSFDIRGSDGASYVVTVRAALAGHPVKGGQE